MADDSITVEALQKLLSRGPYHQWLGIKVVSFIDDGVELEVPWRDEFIVNPQGGYAHGGILATLIDIGGDYAIAAKLGRPVPTVDMRVDYHAPATAGIFRVRGHIVKLGRTFSVASASIHTSSGEMLASGRGTYFTQQPKAAVTNPTES